MILSHESHMSGQSRTPAHRPHHVKNHSTKAAMALVELRHKPYYAARLPPTQVLYLVQSSAIGQLTGDGGSQSCRVGLAPITRGGASHVSQVMSESFRWLQLAYWLRFWILSLGVDMFFFFWWGSQRQNKGFQERGMNTLFFLFLAPTPSPFLSLRTLAVVLQTVAHTHSACVLTVVLLVSGRVKAASAE